MVGHVHIMRTYPCDVKALSGRTRPLVRTKLIQILNRKTTIWYIGTICPEISQTNLPLLPLLSWSRKVNGRAMETKLTHLRMNVSLEKFPWKGDLSKQSKGDRYVQFVFECHAKPREMDKGTSGQGE